MGGMMGGGGMGAWVFLWIFLGLAAVVTAGMVVTRVLIRGRTAHPSQILWAESPAVREAKDALKLRYAHGEIGREEYLQGRVELED
jgi:uncharacterized membrane protein